MTAEGNLGWQVCNVINGGGGGLRGDVLMEVD
jgi:hypothetical protein